MTKNPVMTVTLTMMQKIIVSAPHQRQFGSFAIPRMIRDVRSTQFLKLFGVAGKTYRSTAIDNEEPCAASESLNSTLILTK